MIVSPASARADSRSDPPIRASTIIKGSGSGTGCVGIVRRSQGLLFKPALASLLRRLSTASRRACLAISKRRDASSTLDSRVDALIAVTGMPAHTAGPHCIHKTAMSCAQSTHDLCVAAPAAYAVRQPSRLPWAARDDVYCTTGHVLFITGDFLLAFIARPGRAAGVSVTNPVVAPWWRVSTVLHVLTT